MSTAHQETRAVAAHDASDHHGFDGEPARALPADEPPTPNWVPALGLAVFVVAGVTLLAMSGDGDAAGTGQAAPAGARPAAAADVRPAGARPAAAAAARPAGARPAAPHGAHPGGAHDHDHDHPAGHADPPPPGRRLKLPGERPTPPTGAAAGPAAETMRAAEALGAPAAPGTANLRKLTPEEVERVRRQMQEARQKGGAQQPPAAPK
ncbi:hypothetical protein [Sorangium sp. So ce854]|uniref:hypothetical protein n=1 Tax=Sorangium sp. So ce854 TaxID=3133322 RepID=UPI003F5E38CF